MKEIIKLPPFKRFCMTIGNLPSSYVESLTYAELLYWFCDYLQNKVIPAIDNNAGAVQELQGLFTELQNYVNNYFENLDVQEEINNKLDQMVEQGTLQEIINAYLQANCIWAFNNVNEMLNATNIINGSKCKTLGYYEKNDGGSGLYLIRNRTEQDVIDNGKLHVVNENLVAELIIENGTVNVKQFGAVGNGQNDDTNSIINAVACCDNIEGNPNEIYYTTSRIQINNKNLTNICLKREPFEAEIGNTFRSGFDLTGNNNLYNCKVESRFAYIPSIEKYADPTSTKGLASNIHAFQVSSGISNFYNCKASYCWAFNIVDTAKVNIYNFIGSNLEMSFFVNSINDVNVYNSKFTINKLIDSIYYHHIYAKENTNTKFVNCDFNEIGTGDIGNHYHGYSTSFTENMNVNGKMQLINCNLITDVWAGQANAVNIIIDGGSIIARNLFSDGNLTDKPIITLKNVNVEISPSGATSITFNNMKIFSSQIKYTLNGNTYLFNKSVEIYNSKIEIIGTGIKRISRNPFKLFNTIILCENSTFSNDIANANEDNIISDEIIMKDCFIKALTFQWLYPIYCSNIKFNNNIYELVELKENTNPSDRGSAGYIYDCIFKNWPTPLNADNTNNLKYRFIADNIILSNIS